jgi:hypothetical protein
MGILDTAARIFDGATTRGTLAQRFDIAPSSVVKMFGSEGRGRRSVQSLLELYGRSPWVRLALDLIGNRIAASSWKLTAPARGQSRRRALSTKYRILAEPYETRAALVREMVEDGEVREIQDHPLLTLIRAGVPGVISGYHAARFYHQSKELAGEIAAVLVRDGRSGIPVQMWPVPPSWVEVPKVSDEPFVVRIRGERVHVNRADMVWDRVPDTANPYGRGAGVIGALDHEVEIDEQVAAHLAATFRNRARPDILVGLPGVSEREGKEIEERWIQKLQGVYRQGLPHFMGLRAGEKLQIHELTRSAADMQVSELRKDERDTILTVAGVPPEALGVADSGSRAKSYVARKTMRENKIIPELEQKREFYQQRFLEPRGDLAAEYLGEDRLTLVYDLPPLEDEEQQLEAMKAAPWASDINEWRKLQGQKEEEALEGIRMVPLLLKPMRVEDFEEVEVGGRAPMEEQEEVVEP